jgi:hypothetical protein
VESGTDWEKEEGEWRMVEIERERGLVEDMIVHVPPIFQRGHLGRKVEEVSEDVIEIELTSRC